MRKIITFFSFFFSSYSVWGMNNPQEISLTVVAMNAIIAEQEGGKSEFEDYKTAYMIDYEMNAELFRNILNKTIKKVKFVFPSHRDTNDLITQFNRYFSLIPRNKKLMTKQQIKCSICHTSHFTQCGNQKHISFFHHDKKKTPKTIIITPLVNPNKISFYEDMSEMYSHAKIIMEDPIFKEFYSHSLQRIKNFLVIHKKYKQFSIHTFDTQKPFTCDYEDCEDAFRTKEAIRWHKHLFHKENKKLTVS